MTTQSFGKRTRKTSIHGQDFQIYILNASEGVKIARQLSTVIVPVLGSLNSNDGNGIDFKQAAQTLVLNLDSIDVLDIIKKLLKELSIDGMEVSFDDYFAANYGVLVDITAFALTENFSSFFSGSGIFQSLTQTPKTE
jgi:acyl carrier protein